MTSKRFDLVKNLYAFVLGETEESKRLQRVAQLKNIIAKEIIAGGKLKLSPSEETAIYTTTLKEELNDLLESGKTFEDSEVKSLIQKLKEVGAEPATLQIKEDATNLEDLRRKQMKSHEDAMRHQYPIVAPPVQEKVEPKPKESTPKFLELSKTPPTPEDLSDEALMNALNKNVEKEKTKTPLSKLKKKVEQKPTKFKTQEEMAYESSENTIKEQYKNGELSFNEAKEAWKELNESLSDSEIRNKLSLVRPLSFEEVSIEKYLSSPMASKFELMKELKEKYNSNLSDNAKTLKEFLSTATGEKPSTVLDTETLSPSSVDFQLSIKKDELIKAFKDLPKYIQEIKDFNSRMKGFNGDLKEQRVVFNSLSEGSKKLIKLLSLLFGSSNDLSEEKINSAKDFIFNKYDVFKNEVIDYYKKMKEFQDTTPNRKEIKPIEEMPTESTIWAKPESVFMRSGDILEERTEDVDGKQMTVKVYAPTSRKLIPCPNGHNSTQFEIDKKTKKPIKRSNCEFCGANISIDDAKNKVALLQKEIDLEVENERLNNQKELDDGLISKEEFAKRENELSEAVETKLYKKQLEAIFNRKVQPLKDGFEKLKTWLDEKKIDENTYEKKINQLIEKEKDISDSTDLVGLKSQVTSLTPKPYWELQYGVKSRGGWGLADKSRTKGEDILESGVKAPTEGEKYKVQTVLEKMNVEADEYGSPIFKTNQDGTQEAEALPKGKEVFFTVSDILKKLNFGSPREFKILLAEQEIKNEFLNDQITFEDAVKKITIILNGKAVNLTPQDEIKNAIIAKEKLILEQLRYKKINHEEAISKLEDLGISKEFATEKTTGIVQFDNIPQVEPYLVTRPSYDIKREDTGTANNKTYVWGDDAKNAIWNLNTIRPALAERLHYVEEVLKPQAKIYRAIVNAFTAKSEILKIKETLKKKEESLGLDNEAIRSSVKDLIDALNNDPDLLNRFGRFPLRNGERKGLKEELISYQNEIKNSGEEPTDEEIVVLNGGRREPKTRKTYMQLALDLIEQQQYETKPFNDAVKKLQRSEKAFLKNYEMLPKAVKERMKGKLFSEEEIKELDINDTDEETTESEKSSLDNLISAIEDLNQNPEVASMANTLSDQEKEEEDAIAALQAQSSLRMEKIISLAIACL